MNRTSRPDLKNILAARYKDAPAVEIAEIDEDKLHCMAIRGSCRDYLDRPIPDPWLDILSAVALASPTKSDLQQRDVIMLRSPDIRQRLAQLVPGQAWVANAPMIAVFCGNNRRQRLLHDWHGVHFANDHLDAVVNATGDAAIALGAFLSAAEALGLGCCPISAVRNDAKAVSTLLGLPDHVFPFAGLAFGFPSQSPVISERLPLRCTYHTDRYDETSLREDVQQYDQDRASTQPDDKQRFPEVFGSSGQYAWSDDKVRQYSQPERESFGRYLRARGFKLD